MRSIRMAEVSPAREPAPVRPEGILGLILLLAVTGSALAVFAGAPEPGRLPGLPSWGALEVLARSPNPPLDGIVAVVVFVAWLVWGWAVASVALELALALAEQGPSHGAAWLRAARAAADRLTLPLARRAVAAAIVVQIASRPALPALAFASEPSAVVVTTGALETPFAGIGDGPAADADAESDATDTAVIHHVVQRGDTLWSIAERYYGTGEEFDRVIDANVGKQMPGGRVFDRAGMIYPGWTLDIPLPSTVIEERDGGKWYVVQRGDTLSGIAARLLGDPDRYHELFELNAGARLGNHGPALSSPDLIWPELRLRLPVEVEVEAAPEPATQPQIAVDPEPAPPVVVAPLPPVEAAIPTVTAEPVAVAPVSRYAEPTEVSLVAVTTTPAPTAAAGPVIQPSAPTLSTPDVPLVDPATLLAVVGGAGVAAGLGLAGARVFRRRRRTDRPDEPSIALDQGFALADPARILGQRLAGETEAAREIANRLARAFATVLTASLSESERSDVFGKVALVAVRHGQASTTCVLTASAVARGHLVQHLETAVANAFGDAVDIDGVVTHDGDLFVQVAGIDHRRLRVAVVDASPDEQGLWPEPLLVPFGVLYDRQTLYANWHAINHVLVAAPMGQAAETVVVGLIASLLARRSPAELALVTLASPRTLPTELASAPHQLLQVVDPDNRDALRSVLEQLRHELDCRAVSESDPGVDVVIVVRELAVVASQAWDLLDPLLRDGSRHGIRVLAASERPATELAANCPGLDAFRTRLVLQTADEDASQALLGSAGAEELPPGGSMLLRLEARTPLRAHGFRVAPDHLARLVALMEQRDSSVPSASVPTTAETVSMDDGVEAAAESVMVGDVDPKVAIKCDTDDEPGERQNGVVSVEIASDPDVNGETEPAAVEAGELTQVAGESEKVRPRSDLLRQLDRAPLRLRSFGKLGVWFGERQVWPSSEAVEETGWELVVLLGVHPVAGIQIETLADTIWDEETPPDPGAVLRKRRRRLRQELKRLMPELDLDPLPTDPKGRVYRLDPRVIASDVHRFVELAAWAKSLPRSDAIDAYEEALALYGGDLLESVAVPTYPWLYDGAAIATSLRPDYRRLQEEVRLHLADLYATGTSEDELGRAFDLYTELTAERPDDDRRWISLIRVQGRRGDAMGLEASVRRLRTALVELGQAEKPETARLPLSVQRVLEEVQNQLRAPGETAVG